MFPADRTIEKCPRKAVHHILNSINIYPKTIQSDFGFSLSDSKPSYKQQQSVRKALQTSTLQVFDSLLGQVDP